MDQVTLPRGAESKDYFQILSLTPGAPVSEVRRRWRTLVQELHPDRGGDKEAFQAASEAHDVLSDPERRQAWAATRTVPNRNTARRTLRRRDGEHPSTPANASFLNQPPGGSQPAGTVVDLTGRTPAASGDVLVDALTALQGGEGHLPDGKMVRVPRGLTTGTVLEIGNVPHRVRVRPHPVYDVIGDDLDVHVPVTYPELALGGRIQVPTPDGPAFLELRPGTQPGRRQRIPGRGADLGDRRGDLYVHLDAVVPAVTSRAARRLLEEYAHSVPDLGPEREEIVLRGRT